jgi:hypothetical protein
MEAVCISETLVYFSETTHTISQKPVISILILFCLQHLGLPSNLFLSSPQCMLHVLLILFSLADPNIRQRVQIMELLLTNYTYVVPTVYETMLCCRFHIWYHCHYFSIAFNVNKDVICYLCSQTYFSWYHLSICHSNKQTEHAYNPKHNRSSFCRNCW